MYSHFPLFNFFLLCTYSGLYLKMLVLKHLKSLIQTQAHSSNGAQLEINNLVYWLNPTKKTGNISPPPQAHSNYSDFSVSISVSTRGRQNEASQQSLDILAARDYFPLILLENVKQLFFMVKTLLLLAYNLHKLHGQTQGKNGTIRNKNKNQRAKILLTIQCSQIL